ncbi:hypothetical protein Barb6_01459 [Bacteroidales bacterium Barb6]|nr:hypothetical protein Barb4_02470 [Bacteroidales bacterium Barb4]OAV71320.1 hypothetical protein Barb6_01459 [Bacteroidales bacterium Barb6]OAV75298.1 hypothetical protein Barb7_01088 [Bacteroidales bacterium Barb7]
MKKEFGKWLMDIAKYVVTGVLLSSLIRDIGDGWWIYVVGGIIASLCLFFGSRLIKTEER